MQAGEEKFSACENLAKRLESIDKDVSIVDVKAKLSEELVSLIEAIEERDKKLESAAKIFRSTVQDRREGYHITIRRHG